MNTFHLAMFSKPCCYSLLSSSLVSHIVLTKMSHNKVAHLRRRALFKFRRVSHLVMIGCQFESCSSSAVTHLVLTECVVKQCNQPNCCDRCGQKEVTHCWRRAIFKMTLCYSNKYVTLLWLSYDWMSFWKLLFFASLPPCSDSVCD